MILYTRIRSPIGDLLLHGDERGLAGLSFSTGLGGERQPEWRRADAAFAEVRAQLEAYFAGERTTFDVPLSFHSGTPFQQKVWNALLHDVSFGDTITYGELARRLDCPAAARAVGGANARNPIAIIVPCHRVIGTSGGLTGYAGGMESKRFLLAHEASVCRGRASADGAGAGSDGAGAAADGTGPAATARTLSASR